MNSNNQSIKNLIDNCKVSVNPTTGILYNKTHQEIETYADEDGYLRLRGRECMHISAHKVAAYAYFGDIALVSGLVVTFNNYNRRDIRKCNLKIITRQELQQKTKWHGSVNWMVYDEERSIVVAAFECEADAKSYSTKKYHSTCNAIQIKWRL